MKQLFYTFLLCVVIGSAVNAQVLDSSFGLNGKRVLPEYSEFVEATSGLLQPDGKIVIGGYDYDDFFYYPGMNLWRVNSNGTIDHSFGNNGYLRISGSPYGGSEYGGYLALQPDNKIVGLGTDFDRDGYIRDHLVLFRLKTNGTFDSSFGVHGKAYANFGGFYNTAGAIIVKTDGKIVITGDLEQNRKGTERVELAQFLPNGKPDSSFGVNGTAKSGLEYGQKGIALALLPGNKVLAGFQYLNNNVYQSCLIKYNANGTVDSTFGTKGIVLNKNTTVTYSTKMALAIQADGKIVEYATTNADNLLYRYNANGSIDYSFGVNGRVTVPANTHSLSVIIDKRQRILINTPDFAALRYLSNGKPDSTFGANGKLSTDFRDINPNSYAGSEQLLLQPDSKIVNIGYYDSGDGLEGYALARFKETAVQAKAATNPLAKNEAITLFPNPVNTTLHAKGFDEHTSYTITITDEKGNVRAAKGINNTGALDWNIQNLKSGFYYFNITSADYTSTLKFIKQ